MKVRETETQIGMSMPDRVRCVIPWTPIRLPRPRWTVMRAANEAAHHIVGMAYDTPEDAMSACAEAMSGEPSVCAVRVGNDVEIHIYIGAQTYAASRAESWAPDVLILREGISATARIPGRPERTGLRVERLA